MKEQLALLPGLLGAHVRLVVIALVVCVLASVPLGILATRSARIERIVVGTASAIQTIPALAMLAVMVPVLGAIGAPAIGFLPALIGLTLYCALPILLATVTGIREVSPALLEAARGVGMTERQVLLLVELPLALPFMVAGLRTSAVWCVGMATLSTPVGAPSLGNFIFSGLQTRNHAATTVGCLAAAVLALSLDALVRGVERGVRERRRMPLLAGATGLALIALFAATSLIVGRIEASEQPVRVGTKPFTESFILGHVLGARAESTGNKASVVESLGSTVAFDAVASGDLDAYVDYSGTLWTTVLGHKEPASSRDELLRIVREELKEKYGVVVVASLGFENKYCLATREADAASRGWLKLSQLAPNAGSLSVGADYEFFGRQEWAALKSTYGFAFREERAMDPSLMYQAAKEKQVDVISAYSTDGRIDAFGLRVLEDDRNVIPPYDAVILVSGRFAHEKPDVVEAFRQLEGKIDAKTMRDLNRQVDEFGKTPREVARAAGL
ncbi:MAG: ABC transporter permease subunit [Polyangiaceae bacterium]|nr:ABC transporter permease subunit [Polyangiaceae bacterium]